MKKFIYVFGLIMILVAAYFIFNKKSEEAPASENNLAQEEALSEKNKLILNSGQLSEPNSTSTADITEIKNNMHTIEIQTNYGAIEFTTYDKDAPKTVQNFISLAQKGFYDNLTFHRVIDGFMIQGGDPNGNGTGGPGYKFEDELNPQTDSYKQGYVKGVVAMANAGPNTNGSQFFIMVADYPLQHNYTIFGKVIKGQDVADKIAKVAKDSNNKPLSPVIMSKVTVK